MLEQLPDGSRVIRDGGGLICKVKPGVTSIPAEIGTSLTDREAWETLYLPKLRMTSARCPPLRSAISPSACTWGR